ncbi:unnamed protein product (macronuclear) [Paramecium tetraurelia]|uniref:Transporter n=1 Tax=Paramecium tetraurelia TaxID=5888 RepID=A0DZD3_PARTE|nr:uncharacterized protein GSPATT00003369001 [Paramecium tetraurelia]CAK88400.1 unnamed protein product [Paramecium tetraurelia]|eukprot:XP_001455797.1 hypothetical protein (macronuclear) [Paramecium tetraurelia strain d4-2]
MLPSNKSLEEYQEERMKFTNSWTFMMTALGFAAGFGSVWRFPYLVFKNGGGTFLIPYFLLVFTLAIPLFFLEVGLGQTKGMGFAHLIASEKPKLAGFGFIGIIIASYVSTYYNLIMAYSFRFLWDSFKYPLPWLESVINEEQPFSKSYFYGEILQISDSITNINEIVWSLLIAYMVSLTIVYLIIKEGVGTSGKIAIVTATSPYILLMILLIRGLMLEGSSEGIYYLFKPDFVKLFNPSVWVDAANQVIFQMNVGLAILCLYGSYRKKDDNLPNFSYAIPIITSLCGMLAGLVVFSYIGHVSVRFNIPIDELPLSGPDLAFVLYPAILAQMPMPNLWCILFFCVLVLLGVDTQFGFVDLIAGTIEDACLGEVFLFGYKLTVQQVRLGICIALGILGSIYCTDIGFYLLEFVDLYGTTISFMGGLLFEVYYFGNPKRFSKFKKDLEQCNIQIPAFIEFSIVKLCHFTVVILLIISVIQQIRGSLNYDGFFIVFGWFISLLPFLWALIIYIQQMFCLFFQEKK